MAQYDDIELKPVDVAENFGLRLAVVLIFRGVLAEDNIQILQLEIKALEISTEVEVDTFRAEK